MFLLLLFFSVALPGQITHSPAGLPFIRNYPPDEYGDHNQNWAIVQDHRGVMYFGNSHGLLEYDGVSWRRIRINDFRIARSLAVSAEGRVFAGGYGDFGYLAPDSIGQLQFVSLLPQLGEPYRDFTDVFQTLATPGGVFFVTAHYIFRWDGQKMHTWRAPTAFNFGFPVNGRLYVQVSERGLMQIVSDALQPAPQGEKLANLRISAMLPYNQKGSKSILMATLDNGLFLYDGLSAERFPTGADDLLIRSKVSCATVLSNGQYAFGTMQGGVIVMDASGKNLLRLQKSTGLQDDAILSLYEDRQAALWIAMQVGITRAETGSPFRYFGEQEGIKGSIWEIKRHEGRLYFATIMGLFSLGGPPEDGRFTKVPGVPPACWALLPFGQSLLAATFDGVYEVRGSRARRITDGFVFGLHRSRQDSNRVFLGMRPGVKSLYYRQGQWQEEGLLEGLGEEIRHIYETPDGKLWLVDYFSGLILVDLSQGYTRKPNMTRYGVQQGLPPAERIVAFSTDKGLRFATLQGVFLFDGSRQHFYRDSTLIEGLPTNSIPLFNASPDRKGNIWMLADDNALSGIALHSSEGSYTWDPSPFLRIAAMQTFTAYPDPEQEQITWIGGTDRVVRYDGAVRQRHSLDFPTLIRQIIVNGDPVLYGGADTAPGQVIRLAYANNSLRFRYAAPSFDDESQNEYQYLLEGYDDDWPDWTKETYKDYTRLPPGKYRFLVRARNLYRHSGETAVCELQVLPPFYLTWWAYLLYALLLAGLVFLLLRYEIKRIRGKHLREIKLLEYDKLKELDQLKSRFFADVSHEFRTPLTLILGPLENMISGAFKGDVTQDYLLMRRNARRLLHLINQLLDLSKAEAGKMALKASYGDIIPFIRRNFYAFESLAKHANISQRFEAEMETAMLYFDRDKLEQVLANILSNAFKFMPDGGSVYLTIKNAGDFLKIEVADTGSGIAAEQLPYVFDRFYQGDASYRKDSQGSGIGMALAKELVELHHGQITVTSTVGQGTQFTILLPFGKAHLQDEDIVEQEAAHPLAAKKTNLAPDPDEIERAYEPLPGTLAFSDSEGVTEENILLLVEDNSDMRAFLRAQLADRYKVVEAADGQQGVEKAIELIPDLIISDVMMPGMDGLQLCDTLKNDERTSHIPIILLTAKADVESRLEGLERGADAYLAKPFNRAELLIRSRKLLELRQRLRERYASLQPPEPVEDKGLQIEDAFLQKARRLVESHLSDIDLDMGRLSQSLGMSRSQVYRKVKALTGRSPSVFIRAIRLERAKELLQTTDMNVTEVAYEVGFSTLAYFSDAFLEAFGVRPSELRR